MRGPSKTDRELMIELEVPDQLEWQPHIGHLLFLDAICVGERWSNACTPSLDADGALDC